MVDTGVATLDDFVLAEENGYDLSTLGNEWKSAGSWCAGIIIAHDGGLFDPEQSGANFPDGTWHQYGDQGASHGVNRAQPALYLEMHNHTNDVGV